MWIDSIIAACSANWYIIVEVCVIIGVFMLFILNNTHTLECRLTALEAIRDYNIDQYVLYGRENWNRLKYEKVMQPYAHTWFAFVKDASAAIRPEYLEKLDTYFYYSGKFRRLK